MKGIFSPWAKREDNTPPSIFDGARVGTQVVRVVGGLYVFVVTLQVRPKPENAQTMAMAVFGEALLAIESNTRVLLEELARQKLSARERLIGPCVELTLGNYTLFAAASASDPSVAMRMALDRLALALTQTFLKSPEAKSIFANHFIHITRPV